MMKRAAISRLLLLVMVFSALIQPRFALAENNIKIKSNGEIIHTDVSPIIVNNRVLVPVRVISEQLGFTVNWDQHRNAVIISSNQTGKEENIQYSTSTQLVVNGQKVNTDVPPRMIEGRTMVPVRVISESLGAKVSWNPKTKEVSVVQLEKLLENTAMEMKRFLHWANAAYERSDDGNMEHFNSWVNQKLDGVRASRIAVVEKERIFEEAYVEELQNDREIKDLYEKLLKAADFMEYETMQYQVILKENAVEELEKIVHAFQRGEPEKSSEIRGNSTGNLNNDGHYASYNEWVYFANLRDNGKLYKEKLDGSERQKISEEQNAHHLNIVNEKIYYLSEHRIIKSNLDGTDRVVLRDFGSGGLNVLSVVGDWIYFTEAPASMFGSLYRMKTDGTSIELLESNPILAGSTFIT